ncbi:MAG: hypothetical protein C4575_09525 [Desulforudis sp.]|nr:MAG: hypothetical protein C4575_09525 [Desulforudis sp.]
MNVLNGLDKDQQRALSLALEQKVLVLTGGPGTGKTFTVNHILAAAGFEPHDVALAAPTGKAARRMSETCFGRQASTIHRLLEYSRTLRDFQRNQRFPLDQKLIIIDEASMIDAPLLAGLLAAVRPEARLILVGDKDQLPSVGPGNVFRDLIASRCLPVAELTQIHRQSEHSWIPVNARRINAGQALVQDPASEDFFVEFCDTAEEARAAVIRLAVETIPQKFGLSPADVQLLCPQKKGPLGVFELNDELQSLLNPPAPGQEAFKGFRANDKVIHLRNNYELEVMNGETGTVAAIAAKNGGAKAVRVDYGDRVVDYQGEDLDDLGLAYALTVHKSQGSEWPAVIVPVHSHNAFMLDRNLFYTAVTRGKRLVWVVANQRGLERAIKNNAAQRRYTSLALRLKQTLGKEAA